MLNLLLLTLKITHFITFVETSQETICSERTFMEFIECDQQNAITSFKLKSISGKIVWKNLNGQITIDFNTNSIKDAMKLKKCLSINYFSRNSNHHIASIETQFQTNIPTGGHP